MHMSPGQGKPHCRRRTTPGRSRLQTFEKTRQQDYCRQLTDDRIKAAVKNIGFAIWPAASLV
jgi:hypothetical protein